jgi:hypothetical protein
MVNGPWVIDVIRPQLRMSLNLAATKTWHRHVTSGP